MKVSVVKQNQMPPKTCYFPSLRQMLELFECISDLCSTRLLAKFLMKAYTSWPASPNVNKER